MPKNVKGGKGHKKGKNKTTGPQRQLIAKEGPEQNYGLITKCLGDLRFTLVDPHAMVYLARLRGKMRGRQRVRLGDLVLFTYRETGEKKVDIIMKYNEEQAKRIIKAEGITFPDSEHNNFSSKGTDIVFDDDLEPETHSMTSATKSGTERIMALYNSEDDDYEHEEDYEEDYEDEEDYEIEDEDELTNCERKRQNQVKDKRIAAARDAKASAHSKWASHGTAASAFAADGDINIDDI